MHKCGRCSTRVVRGGKERLTPCHPSSLQQWHAILRRCRAAAAACILAARSSLTFGKHNKSRSEGGASQQPSTATSNTSTPSVITPAVKASKQRSPVNCRYTFTASQDRVLLATSPSLSAWRPIRATCLSPHPKVKGKRQIAIRSWTMRRRDTIVEASRPSWQPSNRSVVPILCTQHCSTIPHFP